MKKAVVIIVATLLITGILAVITILSCNNNGSETNVNDTNTETPDETREGAPDETNEETGELVTGILPNGEPIIWGNLINFPIGEDGYWFGFYSGFSTANFNNSDWWSSDRRWDRGIS